MNIFQCQNCGKTICDKSQFNIEDDLYINMICPNCRSSTPHIWVGKDPEDIYIYGNLNVDPRFYQYDRTIQND